MLLQDLDRVQQQHHHCSSLKNHHMMTQVATRHNGAPQRPPRDDERIKKGSRGGSGGRPPTFAVESTDEQQRSTKNSTTRSSENNATTSTPPMSPRRRPKPEAEKKDITISPHFYRSDRSFSLRAESSRSLGGTTGTGTTGGGRYLDNFYSSRRSLYSNQHSAKSLDDPKNVPDGEDTTTPTSSTNTSRRRLDQSPRMPSKRNLLDDSESAHDADEPTSNNALLGASASDTAPRQPLKRTSISGSGADASGASTAITPPPSSSAPLDAPEGSNHTSRAVKNDSYTKYPEELFNSEDTAKRRNSSTTQSFHTEFTVARNNDSTPRIPQKRQSLNTSSHKENAVFGDTPPLTEEENDDEDDFFYDDNYENAVYLGCDSSVTSELTSPTLGAEFQRPESHVPSYAPSTNPTKLSIIFQQGLKERRSERQKKFDPTAPWVEGMPPPRGNNSSNTSNSGGQSVRSSGVSTSASARTHGSRRQGSSSGSSIMSSQSRLSLSTQVQTLLEMASEVINSDDLDHATFCYQKASQSAGLEIMNINVNLSQKQYADDPASVASRNSSHEDLRLIGIIIGMMRTKMALLHAQESEYDKAIEMCRGALQVQRHQPALRASTPKFLDDTDLASLMVLIIERLENAQACLEDHKELLDKIDLHSTVSDFTETETIQSSTKEIMLDMLERSAHDDQTAIFQYDEFALEMLSVHAAEQDKHDEGIKYCRDALQIHLVALGLKHPRAGKSLLRVARMYRGKGSDRYNEELVLGYFQQTAAVLQRSNLSQRARVSVLNDIAVIHMRRLDFDEAIKFLLDALHAYDEEIDDESISGGRHIATLRVWRNLGECYMQLEKFSIAEGALLKALAIQRDCRKMQDAAEKLEIRAIKLDKSLGKLTSDTSIADTICRIGKARAGGGDYKKALGIYRDALVVLNRDAKSDSEYTELELLEKRDQLTHTLYCIAKAESANKEFDKALSMYQLSLKLRNTNGADTKDKRLATRTHCLSCSLGIGDVFMKQKEFAKAIEQFKDSLEYAVVTQVKENHPLILCAQQKLKEAEKAMKVASKKSPRVVMLEKKADSEIERGALDMATETLKELLVIHRASLKHLKDNEQDTSEQVYAIACLLQTFGFVFAKNGDDENAERAFKDASRLFRKGGQQGATRTTL